MYQRRLGGRVCRAVVLAVWMVRVKVVEAVPGGIRVGLKVAVAVGGIPEAVRRMGLVRVPLSGRDGEGVGG